MSERLDKTKRRDDVIDVVVPLHNNFADANALFATLQSARLKRAMHLIVVDDASTDSLSLDLPGPGGNLAGVTFLRNSRNLGFAASVNRGLEGRRNDVVLLNSDTLVYDGWLDRLADAAQTDARIGTATPLSNAATIFSYPTFPHAFAGNLELGWDEIDRLCADMTPRPVEVPTGVGFCMFVRRRCLDEVGPFDAETFGLGYGEDTDFCRRALKAGWLNVAAANVLVWHRGHGSFQGRAAGLIAEAEAKVRQRHRDYRAAVADFIRRDPLRPIRTALDLRRVSATSRPRVILTTRTDPTYTPDATITFGARGGWPTRWQAQVGNFGPLPHLPTFTAFSSRERIKRFLETVRASQVEIPRQRALPFLLVRNFVHAAQMLGLPVRPAALPTGENRLGWRGGWRGPASTTPPPPR